jgi:hypothetical protein
LAESSLNILVYFYLNIADYTAELKEREDILFHIVDLPKEVGVGFAFPTRNAVGAALDRVRTG